MTATVQQFAAAAAAEIGYYARPGTKNKYGAWYGIPAGAYCAMFLSWVADKIGDPDIIPKHAYTPSGVNAFKAKKQWHQGTKGIRRGDIAYMDFPGAPNRVSHVVFVESVNSDGSVNTIEGNTSGTAGGNQRNGGLVARKRRLSYIVGYGRPAWATPEQAQPVPATNDAADGVLVEGESGAAVLALQKHLNAHYPAYSSLDEDGDYGPATKKVVVEFQTRAGLEPDGEAGPKTLAALGLGSGAAPATPPAAPAPPAALKGPKDYYQEGDYGYEEVRDLQATLNAWYPGLPDLSVDGDYGPATKARVVYFQRKAGLSRDGVAGDKTLRRLGVR